MARKWKWGDSETPLDYIQGLAVDSTDTLATPFTIPHGVNSSPQDLKSQNSNPSQPSSSQSLRSSSSFHSIRRNRRRAKQEKITCQTYFTRTINFPRNEIPMTPHHTHTHTHALYQCWKELGHLATCWWGVSTPPHTNSQEGPRVFIKLTGSAE